MSVSENTFDPEFVRCIVGLKKKKKINLMFCQSLDKRELKQSNCMKQHIFSLLKVASNIFWVFHL